MILFFDGVTVKTSNRLLGASCFLCVCLFIYYVVYYCLLIFDEYNNHKQYILF